MRFLKGSATDVDGAKIDIQSSSRRTPPGFVDGSFAVQENHFHLSDCCMVVSSR